MKKAVTQKELKNIQDGWDGRIGFIPTMGALHEGHLSLVRLAQEKADNIVVSIFVNPTQFAPHEDFETYPRDLEADLNMLKSLGVDAVYTPDATEIYPDGPAITIKAGEAAEGLESNFRPHFFDGVGSVVKTLFEHVEPDIAIFGEKDYQQLMVIREMTESLGLPIDIIGAPIIRDEYGLALSSRNAYLSAHELEIACKLNVILRETTSSLHGLSVQSTRAPEAMDHTHLCPKGYKACDDAKERLLTAGFDKVDYIETRWNRLLAAAYVGKTRLIDNVAFS